MKSQEAALLSWWKQGRSITSLQAMTELGIGRLASRVHDMRVRGVDIEGEWVKQDGKRFMRYRLHI